MAFEVIERERLSDVAQWLVSWQWPLTEPRSIELATSFGWTVIDEDPGKGEIFDTGLLSARAWATTDVRKGEVYEFTLFTSPLVDVSADGRAHVAEVFEAQVGVVSEVLGEPGESEPGVDGSATWQLTSGAVLRVDRTEQSCSWTVESPWFVELQRDVREIEAEDDDEG